MQRLVTISRPLIGSLNGSASGCRTTLAAPGAMAWAMRLPVRPQVLSCSSMMFLRTSQRTMARARGSWTGKVEIFGTMMLCEFMGDGLERLRPGSLIPETPRSSAEVTGDQGNPTGQHQPGHQAHEGFARP